jgi:diguanylate cyclase (GGDEF)-like protein
MPPTTTTDLPALPGPEAEGRDKSSVAALRELLRRPAVAAAMITTATVLAISWPWILSRITGSFPDDSERAWGSGALAVAAGAWAGFECIRGSATRRGGSGRTNRTALAWSAIGTGMAIWSAGTAWVVIDGGVPVAGPGNPVVSQILQLVASLVILIGVAAIPGDDSTSVGRLIDIAIVATAVLAGIWALALPLLPDEAPETLTRSLFALMGAAWIVASATLATRATPHLHSELRGLTYALLAGGLALMIASGIRESAGYTGSAAMSDLLWLTMALALVVSGRRLRRPWVDTVESVHVMVRIHSALPAFATFAALGLIAITQRQDGSLDPVMMTFGILVVVFSGARGLLMSSRNRSLFARLLTTADELRRTIRTDPLTGLGNRLALEDRLDAALERRSSAGTSVFFIDVDNFKRVNDSLGHDAGDELLQLLAARLTGVMGTDVFRIGGDEFVAVREDLDSSSAEAVAAALVAALGPSVQIGAHSFPTGASVGLARSETRADGPRTPDDHQLLMRRADLALYRAKELGRAQWAPYEPWLQDRADRRLGLQRDLDQAIDRHEFEVLYQPVHSLATGKPLGAEALLRWVSPEFGVIIPHEFEPLVNETALRTAMFDARFDLVLADLAEEPHGELWIAFGMDEEELAHPGIAARLLGDLAASGVDPTRMRIETSEQAVLSPAVREALDELVEGRVRICIKGFGTGPSSLSFLSRFTALTLKLDRSLLGSLGPESSDLRVLTAVVELAHELGLGCAADAIATSRQAAELRRLGVDEGQGWHFGPAMRWNELTTTGPFGALR